MFVFDVDGTMTDGGLYYGEDGNEQKKFCTKDATGFFAAREVGIKIMVLTGRSCFATEKRMRELKVDYLFQNVKNKASVLEKIAKEENLSRFDLGYIGDDLNDLSAMRMCGFVACPKDSCSEVINCADYVSKCGGGYGVIRDVMEYVLKKEGVWNKVVSSIYDTY